MLLLTDDEEASFWMLAGLTEDVLSSFISRSAINLYSEAKYVDLEISLNDPEFTAFLNKGECRPSVVVAGFLTRFGLGTLPTESVLRLWDALILEGGEILAPFSILVLKSVKDELMNTDPTTVCDSFDAAAANMFDIGDIIMDAIVSAVIHCANRDYASLVDDFILLGILPNDCDRVKVIPLMDKALTPYVMGGGAKRYEAELKKMYGFDET